MRTYGAMVAGLSALMSLPGCTAGIPPISSGPSSSSVEAVTVSVGPCFGFCPVYDVTVGSDGVVSFVGKRHTAVLGERHHKVGSGAYRSLADELTAFRPESGTEERIQCDAEISDTSVYTVRWHRSDGHVTVATLQSHCPSGPAARLDAILRDLPTRLGVGEWARQTTRPGESRG